MFVKYIVGLLLLGLIIRTFIIQQKYGAAGFSRICSICNEVIHPTANKLLINDRECCASCYKTAQINKK